MICSGRIERSLSRQFNPGQLVSWRPPPKIEAAPIGYGVLQEL
jgi:hypothetical protein